MPAPPYGYGGYNGYGYGPVSQRDAVLNQMQPNYQYPTNPQQVRAPTGTGSKITDIAGGLAPTVAKQFAPQVASSLVEGGMAPAAGLGGAASLGLGLATELGGSLLKPKVQAATASPYADLTDQYERREEGSGEGIAGGAVKWGGRGAQIGSFVPGIGTAVGAGIGALGGAIGGAFNKNAASAYSDFSRRDAEQAIREMYKTRGGRDITPAELNQIMVGAGTKAGDQFVGEQGLYSILQSLDKNFAAERAADPTAEAAQARGALPVGAPVQGPRDPVTGLPRGNTGVGGPSDGVYGAPANTALGTTPAAGAATPAQDTSKWDTDAYAPPAHTAASPTPHAPPGWNNEKWNDPNHQTPKYAVGRILSQFEPRTENMDAIVAEIDKAYPGTKRTGNGDVTIPGVGSIDILQAADVGGKAWHWGAEGAGSGKDAGASSRGKRATGGDQGAGYDVGGDIAGASDINTIIARLGLLAGGGKSTRGGIPSARDLVLQGFKG
jgi:hypothetical protein